MKPGDRIELLRKLAVRLAEDDYSWDDLDLVLRQFGFSTSPTWDDDSKRRYALHHLETGGDESLVELDEYLFGGPSRSMLSPADLPWEAGAFRLFMSHTSANAPLAEEIRGVFLRWRIDTFVAHTTIVPSREWERVIEAALGSCDALAALITDDFVASRWCDQEVGYCLARNVPIVPVKLDVDPHGFIAKYQAATPKRPGTAPWVADATFRALSRHSGIRNLMAAPVVHRYAVSRSYDGARSNFQLLRDLPPDVWTPELIEIVERAGEANGQIKHAVVLEPEAKPMPDAAAELLAPVRERLGMNAQPPVMPTDDDIPF